MPDAPPLKVGDRVRWESADGRRFEGTVIAVDRYGVETTQDSPPDDRRWFHGPKAPLELLDGPKAGP
jgi:hypothetical protein